MSKHEPVGSGEEGSSPALEDVGGLQTKDVEEEEAEDAEEASSPRPNTYREEDWEEGRPPRIVPASEEPTPSRRYRLTGASSDDIAQAQRQMLAELTCEAHGHAMDYFEAACGIDDRVAARSRKLATGCKLATLTAQLVAASDRHEKAMKGG